jgi:hypothetical protein
MFRAGDPYADTTTVRVLPPAEDGTNCYVIDGPGISHDSLMHEPHVGALAHALTEQLDRAP